MVQATFKVYFDEDPDEPVLEARITTETRAGPQRCYRFGD
jgi:hypothetical protein